MIQNAPFFKINIFLILGIMFGRLFEINILIIGFFFGSSLLFFVFKYQKLWYSIGLYLCTFLIGIGIYSIHTNFDLATKHTGVYVKITEKKSQKGIIKNYIGQTLYLYNDSLISFKEDVYLSFYDQKEVKENTLIFIPDTLKTIKCYSNQNSFDFNTYLKKENIHYKLFSDSIVILNTINTHSFHHKAQKRMSKLFPKHLKGISYSLFLGNKSFLSKEEKLLFQKTGNMHLLALSGMHVGIIIILLNFIFAWKKYINKKYRWIFLLFQLLFLWYYAFFSGLSPSIVRAVFMFSIILIGQQFKKDSLLINTLSFTSFCFLLYNPLLLYNIGFQLSFSAVFFIALFPYWDKMNTVPFVLRIPLSLVIVSVLAQLGTLSIISYNFHYIPIYSLFSGLLSGFFITVLMYNGFLIMVLDFLNIPTILLLYCYETTYTLLIDWLSFFEKLPQLPYTSIHYYTALLLFISITLYIYQLLLEKKNTKLVYLLLLFSLTNELYFTIQRKEKAIYFYASKTPSFSYVNGSTITSYIFNDSSKSNYLYSSIIAQHQEEFSSTSTNFIDNQNKTDSIEISIDEQYYILFNNQKITLHKENTIKSEIDFKNHKLYNIMKIQL